MVPPYYGVPGQWPMYPHNNPALIGQQQSQNNQSTSKFPNTPQSVRGQSTRPMTPQQMMTDPGNMKSLPPGLCFIFLRVCIFLWVCLFLCVSMFKFLLVCLYVGLFVNPFITCFESMALHGLAARPPVMKGLSNDKFCVISVHVKIFMHTFMYVYVLVYMFMHWFIWFFHTLL